MMICDIATTTVYYSFSSHIRLVCPSAIVNKFFVQKPIFLYFNFVMSSRANTIAPKNAPKHNKADKASKKAPTKILNKNDKAVPEKKQKHNEEQKPKKKKKLIKKSNLVALKSISDRKGKRKEI